MKNLLPLCLISFSIALNSCGPETSGPPILCTNMLNNQNIIGYRTTTDGDIYYRDPNGISNTINSENSHFWVCSFENADGTWNTSGIEEYIEDNK